MQTGPWAYSILPYVEQGNAYRAQTYAISVPVYLCPTRARTNPQFVPPVDALDESPWSGRTYDGAGINPWGKTDYAGNAMVIVGNVNDSRWTGATKAIAEILDGVSNTILVGEKSLDPQAYNTGGWFWDEPIFAGGGAGGTVRSGDFVVRDSKGVTFSDNWGAAHDRGVPFLFGDGAVHWLRFGVSPAVLHVLLNPSDGQPSQIPD